jgi:all-trans-retinol 13,14-reductase
MRKFIGIGVRALDSPDRMIAATSTGRDPAAWHVPDLGAWPRDDHHHHVAVVGAGIAGLSAGALLASRGCKVLVIEAHDRPGGNCTSWTRRVRIGDGSVRRFIFDAGVQDISGLGPDRPLRRLLAAVGADGRIGWRRVFHRYVQDGLCLDFPDDPTELESFLCRNFPDDARGITAFLAEIAAVYRDLHTSLDENNGSPPSGGTVDEMLSWSARHRHAARWMHRSYAEMLDAFISGGRLKHLFTTIAEYVTDQPERLTVGEMAPLFGYYLEGGFYPAGGSQKLADLLRTVIAENGGSVRLRTRAARFLIEDERVAGIVTASGVIHHARLVIANGDVFTAMTDLIGQWPLPSRYAQRMRALRRGPSAILASLALDFVPDLPARAFVSADGLHFGIGNPSVIDSSLAPPGCAALTLLCLLEEEESTRWFGLDKPAYRKAKEAFADRLIAAAETIIPGLREGILYRQTAAPPTFTRYTRAGNGNIYGAACGQWRPPVKSPVPGLLLAGAGCQNGPGVEAAVISGTASANLIKKPPDTGGPTKTHVMSAQT